MSRFDRLINLALVLAWCLVAYRFGRIYFGAGAAPGAGGASGADLEDEYAEPSPPPPVRACRERGRALARARARAREACARARPARPRSRRFAPPSRPPARPQPTPTFIPGPQAMRPFVAKCYYLSQPNAPIKYEVCGYRTVRQIMTEHYQVFVTGRWTGKWITKEEGGKTVYLGHKYENGDVCEGRGPRHTSLLFECAKDAAAPQLLDLSEPEPCHYQIKVGIKEFCSVNV